MDSYQYAEIEKEYRKIDERWLYLHFRTSLVLVFLSVVAEVIIGFFIIGGSDILNTSVDYYIVNYFLIPSGSNLLLVLSEYLILNSKKLSIKRKIYYISLLLVLICFILFTVHTYFAALFFIFLIPILLTTTYADYKLTVTTSMLSLFAILFSEIFIVWDSDKLYIFDSFSKTVDFFISFVIMIAFSTVCMVIIYFEKEKKSVNIRKDLEKKHLTQKLKIDDLTRIYNRNAFNQEIKKLTEDCSGSTYTFAMIDLDNFKLVNDTLGHIIGDQCLADFGKILTENSNNATPFRFGGDEFCMIFKNQSMEDILKTCEKIRKDFINLPIIKNSEIPLSASIGISHYEKDMSSARLILNTDQALYEAKASKNTIKIYDMA